MADLPEQYKNIPESELFDRINLAKNKLGDNAVVLAHHYQRDSVYQFGDLVGDSLQLSQLARDTSAEYLIFCGVHFMAETADIVSEGKKIVTLPDITAGCPMADMAQMYQVDKAWASLQAVLGDCVVPVTYINSYATLKAFCGRNGGTVCTSTNASQVMDWAFKQKDKVFFFPDQHLGRNTAALLKGIPLEEIVLFNPFKELGGLTESELRQAKVILWSGCCPVHDRFKVEDVERYRSEDPDVKILVHPEVPFEVAKIADYMGSTNYIIKTLEEADSGSSWVVATEVHLVGRLIKQHSDKKVRLLGKPVCMCSMMDRTSPQHLCWNLESLVNGEVVHQISVDSKVRAEALVALERMLAIVV